MMRVLVLVLCVLAVAPMAGCRRPATLKAAESRISALREERESLHNRLELLIDRDTYLATAMAESAEVVVALPEEIIHDLFHEISRNYFDQVELSLTPDDLNVDENGKLRVKTFLGKMTAGEWKVHLDIKSLRGLLSAGTPVVAVTNTNRLHLSVPAHLIKGSGNATLKFDWDPKGLASIVCNKYSTTQQLVGDVIPNDYVLKGDFILTAGEENLMADPEFPPDRFVICVRPSDGTWAEVRKKLEEEDKVSKCGLVFDPDDVIGKLKRLGERGFGVKLPRTIFRPVTLPASISKSVTVGSSRVALLVKPNVLRVTPATFWYSASVKATTSATIPGAGAPSPEGATQATWLPR